MIAPSPGVAPMLTRRTIVAGCGVAVIAPLIPVARAQVVKKAVHIIVGFPAGGGTDIIARILADRLRGPYAATVIVENKPGGAARVAIDAIKNAEPDGSEILFTPDFPITIYPHSFRSLSYDPQRDLVPVAPAATGPLIRPSRSASPRSPNSSNGAGPTPTRRSTRPPRPAAHL